MNGKDDAAEKTCLLAAEKARAILAGARPATSDHPYIKRKKLPRVPSGVRVGRWEQRGKDDCLLVPMYDIDGRPWSVQAIFPEPDPALDRDKDFLIGARNAGLFFRIGRPEHGVIHLCEGFATGCNIHAATGSAVAVAFDAGNLEPVARALRAKYPDIRLVVCADNDIVPGRPNTGLERARAAAIAVGGLLALPELDGTKVDFNDLMLAKGASSVRSAIEGAKPLSPDHCDLSVRLIRGTDLRPEPIRWLWTDHLACGKLHVVAGAPGTGKTTLAMALAATVTSGGRWPDGTRAAQGSVLVWSGEDDPNDTLLPRLLAMGADSSRVYFVGDVVAQGKTRPFDPGRDMESLARVARLIGDVRLVILDPIVNAVTGDSHNNAETRRSLQPVVDLANRLGAAVLGVSHFTKGTAGRDPVERVTGSVAFGALPRVVFGTGKETDEQGRTRRIFVRAKSNIGPDGGGFSYELRQAAVPGFQELNASQVTWYDVLHGTAQELLTAVETPDPDSEADGATTDDWLRALLREGDMHAKQVKDLATQQGLSWRTVQRARKRIGGRSQREGFGRDSQVIWSIGAIDATPQRQAPMASMVGGGAYDKPTVADQAIQEALERVPDAERSSEHLDLEEISL